MRRKYAVAFGLCLLLLFTIARVGGPFSGCLDETKNQTSLAARVDHDPIDIDGNADMLAQKSANNWTGTGESNSPITIADYRIEFHDTGITIQNVDLYFVIENCETADIDSQYYASTGIKLYNCENGVISNSLAHMKETGIFIKNSGHIMVSGSTVHDCSAGISVEGSSYVTIYNNNFSWNDFVGVNITGTNRCTVYENTILSIPYFGVMCIVDTNTYISGNVISSENLDDTEFDHVGIFSYYSVNLAIYNSTITDCAINLEVMSTVGAWIWECCFLRAIEYCIYLHEDTFNVTIIECCIIPSDGITAYDGGEANSWDEPFEEIGNYWSDYIGTGYYYISGPAESIDHFPNQFTCDCEFDNNTTIPVNTTLPTSNTSVLGDGIQPLALIVAAGSSVVILIVVVLIIRSSRSY